MSSTGNRKKNEKNAEMRSVKREKAADPERRECVKTGAKPVGPETREQGRSGKRMPEKSRRNAGIRRLRKAARKHKGLLICAAVAILAAFIISRFFVQLALIRDASMEPAYHNGQIVAVSKIRREYQAGDVIVFEAPQLGCRLVKRIAHVPGDHLSPEEAAMYGRGTLAGYTLPEGAYLVLGDNAAESVDSRDERVGVVSERQIVGKVMW